MWRMKIIVKAEGLSLDHLVENESLEAFSHRAIKTLLQQRFQQKCIVRGEASDLIILTVEHVGRIDEAKQLLSRLSTYMSRVRLTHFGSSVK